MLSCETCLALELLASQVQLSSLRRRLLSQSATSHDRLRGVCVWGHCRSGVEDRPQANKREQDVCWVGVERGGEVEVPWFCGPSSMSRPRADAGACEANPGLAAVPRWRAEALRRWHALPTTDAVASSAARVPSRLTRVAPRPAYKAASAEGSGEERHVVLHRYRCRGRARRLDTGEHCAHGSLSQLEC